MELVSDQNADDFSQIISAHYNNLTKSEKRIADYLRKNQDESAFLSVGELAERLYLSEATLVRFARTLGFASYPSLRAVLQQTFRRRVTHSTRIRGRLDHLRESGDIFERMVVSEMDYMTQALETVSRESLAQAVKLLISSKNVFVFGLGPSISLVELMQIRLNRFGRHVVPIITAGREILESLLLMTEQDLLVVICFFDVSPAARMVLDYANEVKCPVILLTDTLGSIIGDKADVVLAAKRGPVSEFHSLVVPMTIINTLLLAFAGDNQEEVVTHLDLLDQYRQTYKKLSETL